MYGYIRTNPKNIDKYAGVFDDHVIEELWRLAGPLQGARVLNLSVTASGTGVSDLLAATTPLMRSLGIDAEWQIVRGTEPCAAVNNALYAAISGTRAEWTDQMQQTWLKYSRMNASLFDREYDFVVVHDPQPIGILGEVIDAAPRLSRGKWIWHSHLDLREAQRDVLSMLRPYIAEFDAVVFPTEAFARADIGVKRIAFIPPAIDPLSVRNMEIMPETISTLLGRYGIDLQRPLISQVSFINRSYDPLGAIEAYRLARKQVPGLQLVLVGLMNSRDHDALLHFDLITRQVAEDRDIHVLSTLNHVGGIEINAVQRCSAAVVQRAMRRGFAYSLADAQWKERPVVVGRSELVPTQVMDNVTGFLADDSGSFANRIVRCVKQPQEAVAMGKAGKEYIRQRFLIDRYLRDYLNLFRTLDARTRYQDEKEEAPFNEIGV